jgi:hypothetical protein
MESTIENYFYYKDAVLFFIKTIINLTCQAR